MLATKAHTELDAKIDAQADEQGNEGDRYDVEGVKDHQADGGGAGQADDRDQQYRADQPRRSHRHPQHADDGDHRQRGDQAGAFGQGGEFLVLQRHRAGQAHPHAVRFVEMRGARGVADEGGRAFAGLQLGVVEHGAGHDNAAKLARRRRLARNQRAPGEIRRLADAQALHRIGQGDDGRIKIGELGLACGNALHGGREGGGETAQGWVGGQGPEERLGADQLGHFALHVGRTFKQEAVLLEERRGVGAAHVVEQVRATLEGCIEIGGGLLGQFRRRPVDDGDDLIALRVEQAVKRRLALAPRQAFGDQTIGVAGQGKMRHHIAAGQDADQNADKGDQSGAVDAERDKTGNRARPGQFRNSLPVATFALQAAK